MKKLLILPLLLTVLLAGGCSLINQSKVPVDNNNSTALEPVGEIIPEPVPEPLPVSDVVDQPLPISETMPDNPVDPAVACTMDAQICPDGSAVGRVAPDCQFAPCPGQ